MDYKLLQRKIKKIKRNIGDYFNEIHNYVSLKNLNNFRLGIINDINKSKTFKTLL